MGPCTVLVSILTLRRWTAVVRGAVLRGLEGSFVQNRKSRYHYGTSYATVFDDAKHAAQDRYWWAFTVE